MKWLLGIPLLALVGAMLYHALLIGWGFVSDVRSGFLRTVLRCGYVLLVLLVLFSVGRQFYDLLA